ncbi:MAG: cysteine desulfurase family protein [Tissierellia bacterium]|nr:cysteine desulfurase family protein [Tissierellia bacterium]
MIYLDNCATTRPRPEVLEAMTLALTENFANPSSLHQLGVETEKKKEQIRKSILDFAGGKGYDLIFTSGGTESNNTALLRLVEKNRHVGSHVITTALEHSSILEVLKHMEVELTVLSPDASGHISKEELLGAIREDTALISLFHVQNELGTTHPLEEWIPEIRKKHPKVRIHVDGVQAFGKLPVNLRALDVDSYSFSGHKFHGPKGVGGLFLKKGLLLEPLVYGGGQEGGVRSGTENIPGIYGLGAVVDLMKKEGLQLEEAREKKARLLNLISDIEDVRINSQEPASPYILNISLADTRGEVLLHILEEEGIYISTSSACSSHRRGKNPVLEALGLSENEAQGTIRICMSRETTGEELDRFSEALHRGVESLRGILRRR